MAAKRKGRRNAQTVKVRKTAAACGAMAPTPERIAKARGAVRVDAVRAWHCEDAPIERLAARRAISAAERAAGERLYEHWYLSAMLPIAWIDLNRGSGSSDGRVVGMPPTERALYHRRAFLGAMAALRRAGAMVGRSDHYSEVIELVVLHENSAEMVGRRVSGYADRGKAIAVTLDRLRGALGILAVHFGLIRAGTVDSMRTKSDDLWHDSQLRPEGDSGAAGRRASGAMRRHRSLAGM